MCSSRALGCLQIAGACRSTVLTLQAWGTLDALGSRVALGASWGTIGTWLAIGTLLAIGTWGAPRADWACCEQQQQQRARERRECGQMERQVNQAVSCCCGRRTHGVKVLLHPISECVCVWATLGHAVSGCFKLVPQLSAAAGTVNCHSTVYSPLPYTS